MKRYLVAPEAEEDLRLIWHDLLNEAGLAVADRIRDELVGAFSGLSDFPGKGHKRTDLTSRNVLFLSVCQSMIVYRPATPLVMMAVLHGKRDIEYLLKNRT